MMELMVIMQVTTIMLFLLALRVKLWEKSVTTFITLLLMISLIILKNTASVDVYINYHPMILTVYMFLITTRAIFKQRTDKFFGDLHRYNRRVTDVRDSKA
jgi:K+ transporter